MISSEPSKKHWGCGQWSVALGALALFFAWAVSFVYGFIHDSVNRVLTVRNAVNILGQELMWASGHQGEYSDRGLKGPAPNANEAFRRLFQNKQIEDESVFGARNSPFNPDGDIGRAPTFEKALTPGENHWMLLPGMTNESPAYYPLVLENAADASWPPIWLADSKGKPVRGRAWKNDTLVIGFNDGTARLIKLDEREGRLHLPESILKPEGQTPLPGMKILDVEVK